MNLKLMSVVLLCLASVAYAQEKPKPSTTKTAAEKCVAGPDEKCPDAEDYARYKAYVARYTAPQDEMDRMIGMLTRLQKAAPAGMYFDNTKWLYVKNPANPPVAAPANPPSTPPEKK